MTALPGVAIVVLALSLGLDALSVAIGLGLRGVSGWAKVRVGVAFAGFQVGMPVVGILAGRLFSAQFQDLVAYGGFALLLGLGLHMLWESRDAGGHGDEKVGANLGPDPTKGWRLIVASLSVSLDALGAGFSLAVAGLPVVPALLAIGLAAFVMTFAGLQFGYLLGRRIEHRSEQAAGVLLVFLGCAFALRRWLG